MNVTGRLLAPEAQLTLVFTVGGAEVERRVVRVRAADAARPPEGRPGPVAVAWAQGQAEALGLFADRNADALLALGRRFGLVTAGTSILVLEDLQQHLEHGVEPAASRPALRQAYLAAISERDVRRRADEKAQLEAVVSAWKARVAWWEQPHVVPPGWRWQDEERKRARLAAPAEAREEMDYASGEGQVGGVLRRSPPPPAPAAAAPMQKAKAEEPGADASIAIQPWDPQVPYLAALKGAAPGQAYAAYLAERARHAGPGFYLDCAGWFLRSGQRALGIRVLSNLAELRLDDAALLRVMAWRLAEAGELELAARTLEKVQRLRPEEPQSRRDLALVLADRAEAASQPADAARAVALLWEVGRRSWERAPDLELVSLMELNRILARAERRGWKQVASAAPVDPRLRRLLTLDLRVSLSWDVDQTDVDLHLEEPTGEHAYYGHRETRMGGLVSHDVTQGYGPEEYLVRQAVPGDYAVKVHYYGSRAQTLVGPATLVATVYTNWGRPDEKRQVLTLRLDSPRDLEPVGVVTVNGKK
ncbi:MAG: DUF2135 domain-containing protein [Anaeromyxobacter sp.]